MSAADKLDTLLSECLDRLAIVDDLHAREAAKPVPMRNRRLLLFYDKERAVYDFAVRLLTELKSTDPPNASSTDGAHAGACGESPAAENGTPCPSV